jgi:hypothetical protein
VDPDPKPHGSALICGQLDLDPDPGEQNAKNTHKNKREEISSFFRSPGFSLWLKAYSEK